MRALVTGATGFVGERLVARLEKPVVLSRSADRARKALGDVEAYDWDPTKAPAPIEAFDGVDVVFHLAGEPVAEGRWSAAKKQRIRDSRVKGTRNLIDGMASAATRPRVFVSASAVGYYGSRGDEVLDEQASPASDFLAQVCVDWEAEARRAAELDLRVAQLRIGLVLGSDGGAMTRMLPVFKWGLGGRLGNGRQWMAWVHVDDVVGLLLFAATGDEVSGPLNAVAPNPVTNREFTRTLAHALHRPALIPAPAFGLRLALGEFSQVLLASQRVVPSAATAAGFEFQYPQLADALETVVKRK